MESKVAFLTFTLAAVALAGCADDPVSGTIGFDRNGVTAMGTVDFTYTPPGNPFSDVPEISDDLCAVGTVSGPANDEFEANGQGRPLPECTDPHTQIAVHVHELPDPSADGYTVVLVGADGELDLGALAMNEEGMYVLEVGNEQNLDGRFNATEIRMGGLAVGSAGTSGGTNNFEVASAVQGTDFSGTFSGNDLTVEVTGLPAGATFEGWLVSEDAETGELIHDVSFPITGDGTVTYTADMSIDHWVEFHIHVTGSKVNVGIGSIREDL